MSPFIVPLVVMATLYVAMLVLNERIGLLRSDVFPNRAAKIAAYVWLGVFMLALCIVIVASSISPPTAKDLARVPFYSLFTLHAILIAFLLGWWLLTRRPPLKQFLSIRTERPGTAILTGLAVGVGGWMATIALALVIAAILEASGLLPDDPQPSPMVAWLAALPLWKKGLIVLSAMTVEEFFFRAWLQTRIGLVASTILFALAHAGMGQPFLLIGVGIISLIIGFSFYRTRDLVPAIVAHGVFDAIQLFVIIPMVFRMMGV